MSQLWKPTSEKDVLRAIQNGTLRETHHIEVKQSARPVQIAQTLASLAIDGGLFILGIAEQKDERGNKRFVPNPISLEGELERIDGVARNSIDPPLVVRSYTVPSENDPHEGYVVVSVEASMTAPHMVDNKYYGRGEVSKHALSDADVIRLHERRQQLADRGERLLEEAEQRDYLPKAHRKFGHLYLVAEPMLPVPSSVVQNFLEDEMKLREFVLSGTNQCRLNLRKWYPSPEYAMNYRLRDSSVSMVSSDANGDGRSMNVPPASEDGLFDVELTESGGIRIFIGRGTEPAEKTGESTVFDGIAVAYAQRLTYWAGKLSEQYGYGSVWTLGLRLNGIKGLRAYSKSSSRRTGARGGTFEQDAYSRTCTVSSSVLLESPDEVSISLVGRLLKVLGTTNEHLSKVE